MPLKGFRCPASVPTAGNENTFDWCVNQCPHRCLPRSVLRVIVNREATNEHKGTMLTATSLSGCPRHLQLSRQTEFYAEPQQYYAATRGALYHGFLDGASDLPDVVTERRVYKTLTHDGVSFDISGRLDYYDLRAKRIEDFKSANDGKIYILLNKGLSEEHVMQLNVYRWLLQGGHLDTRDGPVIHWPVESMQLHYLLMNTCYSSGGTYTTLFKTQTAPNFGRKFKYETSRKETLNRWGKKQWEIGFSLPHVSLYSMATIEAHLVRESPARHRGLTDPTYIAEGVMHDTQKNWECGYCEVKTACDEIERTVLMLHGFGVNNVNAVTASETGHIEPPEKDWREELLKDLG